jgi:hypothetical protein
MEGNQEEREAVAEHYMWVPQIKIMCLLTAPECRASDVLHGVSKGATYKIIGALEDRFGNLHLAATAYHPPLKTRTQLVGESLQESAISMEHMAHRAFSALHKEHVCR